MWECPKCGRTFRKTNQDHYCGPAPATIEEYTERQPEEAQPYLRQINSAVKAALHDAVQKISDKRKDAFFSNKFVISWKC